MRICPELRRGIVILCIFLTFVIASDIFQPYSLNQAGYTVVGIRRIMENPLPLEGHHISSSCTVFTVFDNGSFFTIVAVEGTNLIFPSIIGHPLEGERVLFRGTSWISTNDSILVHEFYVLDYSSSLIRSVPGIVLFIVMFFMVFKIDFDQLAFVPRREEHA